jgi:hypothetical protein
MMDILMCKIIKEGKRSSLATALFKTFKAFAIFIVL